MTTPTAIAAQAPLERRALIVGAGVFGVSSALALRRRDLAHHLASPELPHLYSSITILDASPTLPSPLSASSDLNRIVRADYASDLLYTRLALAAIAGWHDLNARWRETVYQESGLLLLTSTALEQSAFEHASYLTMLQQGVPVTRLPPAVLAERFPLHAASGRYVDGYFNPRAGWVDCGRALELLLQDARDLGIKVVSDARVTAIVGDDRRARALLTDRGERWEAELIVLCCGAWTPTVAPYTAALLRASPQPVVYLRPPPSLLPLLTSAAFPVCAAALSTTGLYLFPPSSRSLPYLSDDSSPVIKVAHHGPGLSFADPSAADRRYPAAVSAKMVADVTAALPVLKDCEEVWRRMCYYCDSADGDFLVDWHQDWTNVMVVSGDSGHGFKFAPCFGDVVVGVLTGEGEDAAEWERRFRWREPSTAAAVLDAWRSSAIIH